MHPFVLSRFDLLQIRLNKRTGQSFLYSVQLDKEKLNKNTKDTKEGFLIINSLVSFES